eukprot:TRINITY_DN22745_c0_g1_i3.p2 TRINITY_DN22745_c0_g1~~TRINITY_DN22745_c0_g1_i3.p2  ORF type:complete len:102 (+),score=18.21 TRINITY_DN22745_c0_g1_i3:41-346(+)
MLGPCVYLLFGFFGVMLFCVVMDWFFFFFKQKTAYEMQRGLVGSEMCIRDRHRNDFYNDQFLFLGTAITYISILFSILTILLYISPFFPIFILNSWNYMGD